MKKEWENISQELELKDDKIYFNNMGVLFFRAKHVYGSH